jgi:hypothetical protein
MRRLSKLHFQAAILSHHAEKSLRFRYAKTRQLEDACRHLGLAQAIEHIA